uniref:Uncharacterized protein n=1 Tax=Cucumis melo TaxID=3656 RepID=A0A9I9E765_CUCME
MLRLRIGGIEGSIFLSYSVVSRVQYNCAITKSQGMKPRRDLVRKSESDIGEVQSEDGFYNDCEIRISERVHDPMGITNI